MPSGALPILDKGWEQHYNIYHGHLAKAIVKKFDLTNYNDNDPGKNSKKDIDDFINMTKQFPYDYVDILKSHSLLTLKDGLHLRYDWFTSPGQSKWFPHENGKELERKIALGTVHAFELSIGTLKSELPDPYNNRPVEIYWMVPVMSPYVQFDIRVEVVETKYQINVCRITPMPIEGPIPPSIVTVATPD